MVVLLESGVEDMKWIGVRGGRRMSPTWAGPHPLCRTRPLPSSRKMMVVFLPRELEATHSAHVSNSSGVTRTFRTLRTLCGSWSCSLAYKEGGTAQGWEGVGWWQQNLQGDGPAPGRLPCAHSPHRGRSTRCWAEGAPRLHRTDSALSSPSPTSSFPLMPSMGALREGRQVETAHSASPPSPPRTRAPQGSR